MKKQEPADFNHLGEWLLPKLEEAGLSVERLGDLCGRSKASIYFWITDKTRPDETSMLQVCQVLGPKLGVDVAELFAEALRQYTPKKNGRPKGSAGQRGAMAR